MKTTTELVEESRNRLDDLVQPYLWSDNEILSYLNMAQNELCEEGLLISDSQTTAICKISITNLTTIYPIDKRIIRIKDNGIRLITAQTPLQIKSSDWMNYIIPLWRDVIVLDVPQYIITDLDSNYIHIYPKSPTDDTIVLDVWRYPLSDMNNGVSPEINPEIDPIYHLKLIDKVLSEAYLKQDSMTFNQNMASIYKSKWENTKEELKRRVIRFTHRPRTIGVLDAFK